MSETATTGTTSEDAAEDASGSAPVGSARSEHRWRSALTGALTGARDGLMARAHALSLRARLIAVVTALLVVALLLTGTVTLLVLQRVLVAQTDEQLRSAVSSGAVYAPPPQGGEDAESRPSDYVVQITDGDGVVLRRSRPTQDGKQLTLQGITSAWVGAHGGRPVTISTTDDGDDGDDGQGGEAWRVVAVPVADGSTTSIAVARSLEPVDATLRDVAAYLVLVGVVVVLACVLLGAYGVRRAFRPLRHVEAVTAAFGGGDTSRRVQVAAPGTEVGRLGTAVNGMLDSIGTSLAAREASENRMRRFVADASHELRTPLSAIRGFAEMHRIGIVRKEADVTTAFSRIESEATRMGGLVEDLLVLARLDEQRPMRHDPVDLLSIVADARHDARALAPDRTVTVTGVEGSAPVPVVVTGDEAKLRQVLANLIGNALRHTPAGTPVELGVGQRDGWAVWRVADHGPGIAPEDAERVFERFWRADSSRQRGAGGGAGLGMAIVAGIVQAHGGAVRVVATPGGGATIEVALPLAGGPPQLDDDLGEPDDLEGVRDGADPDGGATAADAVHRPVDGPVDGPVQDGAPSTGGRPAERGDPSGS